MIWPLEKGLSYSTLAQNQLGLLDPYPQSYLNNVNVRKGDNVGPSICMLCRRDGETLVLPLIHAL